MRKSFAILLGILVCALTAMGEVGQPQISASASSSTVLEATVSPVDVATRIAEARQLLQSTSSVARDSVSLAVLDSESAQLRIIRLSKDEFLTKDAVLLGTTNLGRQVRVQIVRANGVNTAVNVTDVTTGQSLVPLMVQFPIVKNGGITEVAYYTSAHPALLT